MADKVRVHEIAKAVGISSGDLIEICARAGMSQITHHSNAVSIEQAEEIRKAAIRLYKPKEQPVIKERPPAGEPRAKRPERKLPSTRHVKPVPPPAPKGSQAARGPAAAEEEDAAPVATRRRRARSIEETQPAHGEKIRKRTIVFRQPKRQMPERKRETKIEMPSPVSVRDLSERLGLPASRLLKELMFEHGIRVSVNHTLDDEVVQLLGLEHGVEITLKEPKSAEELLLESLPEDPPGDLAPRPPVVALLGHVDHGKTSILDRVRNTQVAAGEAGGITQDIAAWQVQVDGRVLTFVDTPGHEAFTAMRARGAKVTDIVVLVVAADDGVMPQTVEAIDHARAANVPIVVAINKVDKPDANPMRVRQQLSSQGLMPEEWGGEVGCVDLSALAGKGISELLERIALEAELLDVRANPNRQATGAVLEARMQPGRGVVTNVIVRNGTLRRGDTLVCGDAFGTVRSIYNDRGEEVPQAGPGQPVAFSGLGKVPEAGEAFIVVGDADMARKVADEREEQLRRQRLRHTRPRVTLENLYDRIQRGDTRQLNVILKGDTQGSLDPLVKSLSELGNDEVSVKLIHSGVGDVNTSDVLLAQASEALILAYRVREDEMVRGMAAAHSVDIRRYSVIYDVADEVRQALEGLLEPEVREERLGVAEVRQTFRISHFGTVAGCYVQEGAVQRGTRVRVLREGQVIHTAGLGSLRQGKSDVRQVEAGRECGVNIEGFNDIQAGDTIECFQLVTVKRTLAEARTTRSETPES